jgi:hypothetical protein
MSTQQSNHALKQVQVVRLSTRKTTVRKSRDHRLVDIGITQHGGEQTVGASCRNERVVQLPPERALLPRRALLQAAVNGSRRRLQRRLLHAMLYVGHVGENDVLLNQ